MAEVINWKVLLNLNNDADFIDANEDISTRVDIEKGITATRGRDPSRAFGEPRIPAMEFTSFNDDYFWSTASPSSPLYGQTILTRPTRLQMVRPAYVGSDVPINDATVNINSATTLINGLAPDNNLFTGYVDSIKHLPNYNDRRVTVRCLGAMIKLRGQEKLSTALYTNITTGAAMNALLDAIGWPSTMRKISGTTVVLKYWWLDREDSYDAAVDLLLTEGPGAALYEDELGNICFEGQSYRTSNTRSTSVQASFLPSDGIYFAEPEHEDGADLLVNTATYHIKERELQPTDKVWSYSPTVVIPAGETKTFVAYTNDPITNIQAMVAGTDYVLSFGALSAATAVQETATRVLVSLTSSGAEVTLTGLQFRAQAYAVVDETDAENNVDTSASVGQYGPHVKDVSGRAEIDVNVAASICDTTVLRYMDPRALNYFTIYGIDTTSIEQIINRQISDRIHFTEIQTGQDVDSYIESKSMQIVDDLIACTFGAERTLEPGTGGTGGGGGTGGDYALYDDALYDDGVYGQ